MTDAAPEAPPRPKRSMRLPMLVLAILGALLAGVWWHIRSQHHPSLPLTGEVVGVSQGADGRMDLEILIHGLTETIGVKSDIDAVDAAGRTQVVGFAMRQRDDASAMVTVGLQPSAGVEWVSVTLVFSHEVAAVTPLIDRVLHLAPRREQIGQVTLTKVALPKLTPLSKP